MGQNRVGVAIEIKNGPIYYPGIAEKTIRLVREHGMERQVILISFDHFVLREAEQLALEIATGILYVGGLVDGWGGRRRAGGRLASGFLLRHAGAGADGPRGGAGDQPVEFNDLPTLRMLSQMGVDSVGTDYPELFGQV